MSVTAFFFANTLLLASIFSEAAVEHASYLASHSVPRRSAEVELVSTKRSIGTQTEPVSMVSWILEGAQLSAHSACPICLEDASTLISSIAVDSEQQFSGGLLVKQPCSCRPKYHISCLLRVVRCPTCREGHSSSFRQELQQLAQLQRNALERCPQESVIPSFFAEIEKLRQQGERFQLLLSHDSSDMGDVLGKKGVKRRRHAKKAGKSDLIELFRKDRDKIFATISDEKEAKRFRDTQNLIDTMLSTLAAIYAREQGAEKLEEVARSGWVRLLARGQEEFKHEQAKRRRLSRRCNEFEQRLQKLHKLTRQETLP